VPARRSVRILGRVLSVDPHPLLAVGAFATTFGAPLGELVTPDWLTALFAPGAAAPLEPSETLRRDVRALLRHGGYKPTGRGKPSAEYLVRAAGDGALGTINLAVDACNAVSLHSGLPISVVDLDLVREPLRIRLAEAGTSYVFNASGQEIRVDGLLCLFDADGPCANAVKDAQRSKTRAGTRRTLSIVWGTNAHPERTGQVVAWYRETLERAGAATEPVEVA
jgi:DNA/RNA-binding domain of Phe-tRNA-synthetase-like protein